MTSAIDPNYDLTEERVEVERLCGFYRRNGVSTDRLNRIIGKVPSQWDSGVIHRLQAIEKWYKNTDCSFDAFLGRIEKEFKK